MLKSTALLSVLLAFASCKSPDANVGGESEILSTSGGSVNVYCMQVKPPVAGFGYIISSMKLSQSGSRYGIRIEDMGLGIIGEQGDGTVDTGQMIFSAAKDIARSSDPADAATSPQWKTAIPFRIPLNEAKFGKQVILVPDAAFVPAPADFVVRIKMTLPNGKADERQLQCNRI